MTIVLKRLRKKTAISTITSTLIAICGPPRAAIYSPEHHSPQTQGEHFNMQATTTRYPWGSDKPSNRLRSVSSRLHDRLTKAREPEYRDIHKSISEVISEARLLVDALDFLAGHGLRSRKADAKPVDHSEITSANAAVHQAVTRLKTSSAIDMSDCYKKLEHAIKNLLDCADRARSNGVNASMESPTENAWDTFTS